MASSKEYLDFVLEQLSDLDGITFRPMMGEYLLYVDGRLAGGVYDNRLLVKPVPSAAAYVGEPVYQLPYEGAKPRAVLISRQQWLEMQMNQPDE